MASHAPSYQIKGIVIGRTNFGEADRVVRFFTPDRGKVSAVAKGVRKIKSRSGGHLELFGEVSLMLISGRNLDTITSARLMWYPHQLVGDYSRLGLAFAITTAIDRLTEPDQPAPALYSVIREALGVIDQGATGPLVELWFKLRLLELTGYRPELNACVVCGRTDPALSYSFDASRGGITCESDAGAVSRPMTQSVIKLWRLMSDYPFTTIAQIAGAAGLAASSLEACDEFYEHHLGRAFRPQY
jgi:DNA repair protein RecO (recombination protein O)